MGSNVQNEKWPKTPILAKNTYFESIYTILDIWTHFLVAIFRLETDYSMGNEDLATHKKFFKNRKNFFFQKKVKKT